MLENVILGRFISIRYAQRREIQHGNNGRESKERAKKGSIKRPIKGGKSSGKWQRYAHWKPTDNDIEGSQQGTGAEEEQSKRAETKVDLLSLGGQGRLASRRIANVNRLV